MSPQTRQRIIENLKKVEEEVSTVRRSLEADYTVDGEALCHASIVLDNTYTDMAAPEEEA